MKLGLSPHAPHTLSPRLMQEIAELARGYSVPMAVHLLTVCRFPRTPPSAKRSSVGMPSRGSRWRAAVSTAVTILGIAALLVAVSTGPSPSAQSARMKQVMRTKLDHSQRILEAVVTSNWQQLDRESRAMATIVRDPAWAVLAMPEYVRHSGAFLRATDDLIEAATSRDLESASLGFISLTTSCVSCHRYLARARIATARP